MLALGLLFAVGIYLGAIYLIAWTARRGVAVQTDKGSIDGRTTSPSAFEIVTRHGLTAIASFIALFVLLNLIEVPLWQQLLITAVLAGLFASLWLQGEKDRWTRREKTRGSSAPSISIRQRIRVATYWNLVWFDWFGFMASLCFVTTLAWRIGA